MSCGPSLSLTVSPNARAKSGSFRDLSKNSSAELISGSRLEAIGELAAGVCMAVLMLLSEGRIALVIPEGCAFGPKLEESFLRPLNSVSSKIS